jgi:hypothetical protein
MIEKALEELAKATSANTAAIVALTAAMSGSKVAAAVKSEKAATEKPPKAADKSGKPEKASKAEEYTGDDLDEDEEGAEDDEQEVEEEEPAPKAKKPAAKAEAAAKPDKNEATLADVKAAFVAYLGYGKTDDEDHTKEYDKRHAAMTKFCASCDKEADRPSKLSEEHWTKAVKWAKSKLAELAEEV